MLTRLVLLKPFSSPLYLLHVFFVRVVYDFCCSSYLSNPPILCWKWWPRTDCTVWGPACLLQSGQRSGLLPRPWLHCWTIHHACELLPEVHVCIPFLCTCCGVKYFHYLRWCNICLRVGFIFWDTAMENETKQFSICASRKSGASKYTTIYIDTFYQLVSGTKIMQFISKANLLLQQRRVQY